MPWIIVRSFEEMETALKNAEVELHGMLIEALNMALYDTLQYAQDMSSGDLSKKDLEIMDHPFARRHGAPLIEGNVINVRTGNFLSHWKMNEATTFESMLSTRGRVYNDSMIADYLVKGTKNMFARPLDEDLEEFLKMRINYYVKDALDSFDSMYG